MITCRNMNLKINKNFIQEKLNNSEKEQCLQEYTNILQICFKPQ